MLFSKSPRSTVSYCFPVFPGALPGFPGALPKFSGSPGISPQKVQGASEGSRRSLKGSRRLIFWTFVNNRLLLLRQCQFRVGGTLEIDLSSSLRALSARARCPCLRSSSNGSLGLEDLPRKLSRIRPRDRIYPALTIKFMDF